MAKYTHKICELGNGFPFDGEIIIDKKGNFWQVIETSQIHTEQSQYNYVLAVCEDVDAEINEYWEDFILWQEKKIQAKLFQSFENLCCYGSNYDISKI